MNNLAFVGRVASTPTLTTHGTTKVCKFTLIRNEFAGTDDAGGAKQRKVAIPFTAFGSRAEAIAEHVMTGDQLIVQASIENNNYTKGDVERFDYNFKVVEFDFGAPGESKRAQLQRRESASA